MLSPAKKEHVANPLDDDGFPPAAAKPAIGNHQRAFLDRVPARGEAADPSLIGYIHDLSFELLQLVGLQRLQ